MYFLLFCLPVCLFESPSIAVFWTVCICWESVCQLYVHNWRRIKNLLTYYYIFVLVCSSLIHTGGKNMDPTGSGSAWKKQLLYGSYNTHVNELYVSYVHICIACFSIHWRLNKLIHNSETVFHAAEWSSNLQGDD